MFKEDADIAAVQKEHDDAVARKKLQLAEANVEHDKLIAEEDAEEKVNQEKAAVDAETKAIEDKRLDAQKRQQELFQAIDRGEAV